MYKTNRDNMPRVYKDSSRTPRVELFKAFVSFIKFRIAARRKDQAGRLKHALEFVRTFKRRLSCSKFCAFESSQIFQLCFAQKTFITCALVKNQET